MTVGNTIFGTEATEQETQAVDQEAKSTNFSFMVKPMQQVDNAVEILWFITENKMTGEGGNASNLGQGSDKNDKIINTTRTSCKC